MMWKYLTFTFILITAFFILLFNTGWASDDAYITLRTVNNFVTGDGLVWNIGERVQVYTHPLWLFLLSAIYFFTREDFFTLIFTSIAVSVVFAFYSFAFIAKDTVKAFILFSCFVFSKAFIDYSTSGLENPLSHILIAVFILFFNNKEQTEKNFLKLFILSSLLLLTRLDFIFLIGPSLLHRLLFHRSLKKLFVAILSFLPLWLWEIFSIIYYGFPFPNTAYAKLYTGITFWDKIDHGLWYLANSIITDHVTLPVIGVSILILLSKRKMQSATIVIGTLVYLAYIVSIGGDFMSGRFITAPFVFVLLAALMEIQSFPVKNWIVTTVIFTTLAILGMTIRHPPLVAGIDYGKERKGLTDKYRIVDERRFYFQSSGLKPALHSKKSFPIHVFAQKGRQWKKANTKIVRKFGSVGFAGYLGGSKCHLIDFYGLTDPLLARIPAKYEKDWKPGHFIRTIPAGYIETIKTGKNHFADKDLQLYYETLKKVTTGHLFTTQRWKQIVLLNIGYFDNLINFKRYRFPIPKPVITKSR